MKTDFRTLGIKSGLKDFYLGKPCVPPVDLKIFKERKAKEIFISGWIDGWRSGELENNGGW